jgi:hypothetical protein
MKCQLLEGLLDLHGLQCLPRSVLYGNPVARARSRCCKTLQMHPNSTRSGAAAFMRGANYATLVQAFSTS